MKLAVRGAALVAIIFASATMARELTDQEMRETRGGVSVTSWAFPSAETTTDINADNIPMWFGLESALDSDSVMMGIYSGNSKMGYQSVPTTTVLANGHRSGVYASRLYDGPLRDFTSTSMRMDVKYDNNGQATTASGKNFRNVNIHNDIVVRYVKFHMLREPDGDESVFSVTDARDLIDSMTANYTVTSSSVPSADAVLMTGDCDLVSERTNLRACTASTCTTALIDTVDVSWDGATTPEYTETWWERFRGLSDSLSGGANVYHVFLVTDITTPGVGGYAGYNNNYAVIQISSLTWMKGTLVHELGHSQGMEHTNLSEDNCDSSDQTTRNIMCGNGHGVRIKQSQCAQYRDTDSGLHDYN